jgi:hypothetical protein
LWSLHPKYLDRQGLLALWREGLLAQKVLRGHTWGYRHHPQLQRFRETAAPLAAMRAYLAAVLAEAHRRGYAFKAQKVGPGRQVRPARLPVTRGQIAFERAHLAAKLGARDPASLSRLPDGSRIKTHPLFRAIAGPREVWEKSAQ